MAIAKFDYNLWVACFPELSQVNEAMAGMFFRTAEIMLNNTDTSMVSDATVRLDMLNYIVAHIASLRGYPTKAGKTASPSGVVGRISNATEGSVSVGTTLDLSGDSNSAAFWTQTQYGMIFWKMIAPYRGFKYRSPPDPYMGPILNTAGYFY